MTDHYNAQIARDMGMKPSWLARIVFGIWPRLYREAEAFVHNSLREDDDREHYAGLLADTPGLERAVVFLAHSCERLPLTRPYENTHAGRCLIARAETLINCAKDAGQ